MVYFRALASVDTVSAAADVLAPTKFEDHTGQNEEYIHATFVATRPILVLSYLY